MVTVQNYYFMQVILRLKLFRHEFAQISKLIYFVRYQVFLKRKALCRPAFIF